MKLIIKVAGSDEVLELTLDQARNLYSQLGEVFGAGGDMSDAQDRLVRAQATLLEAKAWKILQG